MILDALQLTILNEESHQSVLVGDYRIDFIYNSLINRWFLNIYYKDELLAGGIKIIPNKNLVEFFSPNFEIVVISNNPIIDRAELALAKVVYIPIEEENIYV